MTPKSHCSMGRFDQMECACACVRALLSSRSRTTTFPLPVNGIQATTIRNCSGLSQSLHTLLFFRCSVNPARGFKSFQSSILYNLLTFTYYISLPLFSTLFLSLPQKRLLYSLWGKHSGVSSPRRTDRQRDSHRCVSPSTFVAFLYNSQQTLSAYLQKINWDPVVNH